MSQDQALFYRLDKSDTIVEAGGQWNEMATQSGAAQLTTDNVIGTRLYDHVTGEATRMFVWTMFDAVRVLKRPSTKLYRCDTPECSRHMKMIITPDTGGGLKLEHSVIRIEPLSKRIKFALGKNASKMIIRCSSCNRVRAKNNWQEPDSFDTKPYEDPDGKVRVVYGVCDECQSTARIPGR